MLAETLLFAAAGTLLRRLEPVRLLALAGAVTALRWGLSALSTELAVLLLAQSLHAVSFGATHLAAMHYLRDQVPAELQASAQGFYAALGHALPLGLVTPVAGWLYATSGGQAFWPMAALALAGSAISARLALRDRRAGGSVGDDLERALAPPAEADGAEVLVEREGPTDVQALDQREAGAVDDAERLVGPLLRDLASAPEVLWLDIRDRDEVVVEAVPERHGRPAAEPGAKQAPGLDDDVVAGLEVLVVDARREGGDRLGVMPVGEIGEREEGAGVDEELIHGTLRPARRRAFRRCRRVRRCRGRRTPSCASLRDRGLAASETSSRSTMRRSSAVMLTPSRAAACRSA